MLVLTIEPATPWVSKQDVEAPQSAGQLVVPAAPVAEVCPPLPVDPAPSPIRFPAQAMLPSSRTGASAQSGLRSNIRASDGSS
jgi:hypothetical protein